jgi:exopolysaccharide biosynthesis polyprenyl glycosylphosphotransferase
MINTKNKIKQIILILGDIVFFYFSLWLTLLVRYQQLPSIEIWSKHILPFSLIFVLWLIVFYIFDLFEISIAKNNSFFYSAFLKSIGWCVVLAVVFFYIFEAGIAPKTNLFIDILFTSFLLVGWRFVFNKFILTKPFSSGIIFIGAGQEVFNFIKKIKERPQLGFEFKKIILPEGYNLENPNIEKEEMATVSGFDLKTLIENEMVSTVVLAGDFKNDPKILSELYQNLSKINIFDLPSFSEKVNGKIPVRSIGEIWFLENLREESKSIYNIVKRLSDIILALILLIVSLPFLPFIFLAVKFDSKGKFLFKQNREGETGNVFQAIKIRSMVSGAEKNGPQWASVEDSRITRVGSFLRKTRIDEIPQLFNVLKGEMSFIGPRPERPEFIKKLSQNIPFYNARQLVKPGLTGWAQVSFPYGASEEDALEKLQYDLYYIKNRSLGLDISILLKTIKTVLGGGGR